MGNRLCAAVAVAAALATPRDAAAQEGRPFADRFLYGGEVTANFSPDDPGYFNATQYRRNGFRLLRVNFALEFQVTGNLSILTEIRSDNLDVPEPYALYLRFRPWMERAFDIQVGRIPPVFGAFSRRRYDYDNPLIGYPLAYQYRTTVRADALPTDVDQVLGQRGYGYWPRYPAASREPRSGLPLANPLKWDTGVQVKLGNEPVAFAFALTQGTIGNPLVRDDNEGKQLAGRLAVRPAIGVVLGASAARGDYVADEALDFALGGAPYPESNQTSLGADAEISRGHWLVRSEAIWTRWDSPTLSTEGLDALAITAEGKYTLTPALYLAARFDRMGFSKLGEIPWDAPVSRVEVGGGYKIHRHLLLKVVYQYNWRNAGPVLSRGIPAVQALFWF